jgi:DNA polymerase III subunit gamma/tau
MGQALYRKYRSKSLDDVVGQDHITKTLRNALASGRISHAYLFTGPRGVGKTSVARILAHEVNELPYTDESIHLDIIEIDAASNRRIDEIRDLRDKVNIAPTSGKYKVYIIDEVHMLTREAFNALLKTLEEPPAHCIFILATTEAHKLPETIISRTQRFEFKPINAEQVSGHLGSIAKEEKIDINQGALRLLAEFGAGSFRDSISYLDQLSSYKKQINADDVRELLGMPAKTEITKLMDKIAAGSQAGVIEQLNEVESRGVSPTAIAEALSELIRQTAGNNQAKAWQIGLLNSLLDVSASHRPQDSLEVALLSAATNLEPAEETSAITPKAQPAKIEPEQVTENVQPVKPTQKTTAEKKIAESFDLSQWNTVLDRCKQEAASIYTALRLAEPTYTGGRLTLNFQFPLHQKKLEQAKNKSLVQKIIEEVCSERLSIESVLTKRTGPSTAIERPAELSSINNIFGNAEVIEA